MTITLEQVHEYFDNVPTYRVGEQLEELLSNFPNQFTMTEDSKIEDLEIEIYNLQDRIEYLENIIYESIYELDKDNNNLEEKIENALHELNKL